MIVMQLASTGTALRVVRRFAELLYWDHDVPGDLPGSTGDATLCVRTILLSIAGHRQECE